MYFHFTLHFSPHFCVSAFILYYYRGTLGNCCVSLCMYVCIRRLIDAFISRCCHRIHLNLVHFD